MEEKLNLQQKFLKLREAIPKLTKQDHGTGVKYKFNKISSIYEFLTPAMNKYGVNLTISGEHPTMRDANGQPLYYRTFQQANRTCWIYESDLDITWTDVDTLKQERVTLHAIGESDHGPDKAKGSAWTYCLKYYLLEKFTIDEGDGDPDNKDLSGKSQETMPNEKLEYMYIQGAAAGFNEEYIKDWLIKRYKVKNEHYITTEQYNEAFNILAEQANKKKEGNQ
jgi:hypothetical protein